MKSFIHPKHYMLQNVIQVFTVHPFPPFDEGTYHPCDKIHVKANHEIPNYHFVLFYVLGWIGGDIINPSIPYRVTNMANKIVVCKI